MSHISLAIRILKNNLTLRFMTLYKHVVVKLYTRTALQLNYLTIHKLPCKQMLVYMM